MAEIAGLSFAVIGIARQIAKNLCRFISKAKNCSDIIHTLHQDVQRVERDTRRVEQAATKLNSGPGASTLADGRLDALKSLQMPLSAFHQKLGDLHEGQPTSLGRLILTFRYEACRDELVTFQQQIDNEYRSLQLAILLAQLVGHEGRVTDRAQPLPLTRPIMLQSVPRGVSSNELLPGSRRSSNTSTLCDKTASKLFRATERLDVAREETPEYGGLD
ncbi:MAG: hypothetical protein M1839_000007 [Geoglossum umbratile]|nr:MAG: hypothetical protein M1839_000007 [Geoglossum umbratile]